MSVTGKIGDLVELGRLSIGILAAVSVPQSLHFLRNRPILQFLLTAMYGLYVSFTFLPVSNAFVVGLAAGSAGLVIIATVNFSRIKIIDSARRSLRKVKTFSLRSSILNSSIFRVIKRFHYAILVVGVSFAISVIAGISLYGYQLYDKFVQYVFDERFVTAVSALFIAVFPAGEVVYLVVQPFLTKLGNSEELEKLLPTSAAIGWVERALIFLFVAGGQAGAAALAIAAKALVRFPRIENQSAGFAEYFLVGTLTSLLAATGFAILLRFTLGMSPL